jgi:hypothetical protein
MINGTAWQGDGTQERTAEEPGAGAGDADRHAEHRVPARWAMTGTTVVRDRAAYQLET